MIFHQPWLIFLCGPDAVAASLATFQGCASECPPDSNRVALVKCQFWTPIPPPKNVTALRFCACAQGKRGFAKILFFVHLSPRISPDLPGQTDSKTKFRRFWSVDHRGRGSAMGGDLLGLGAALYHVIRHCSSGGPLKLQTANGGGWLLGINGLANSSRGIPCSMGSWSLHITS